MAKRKYPKHPMRMRVVERKLGREAAWGQTIQGDLVDGVRILEVDPRQKAKPYLDTVLHEALHQLLPYRCEDFIEFSATSLAQLLWKCGYRRTVLK